MWPAVSCINKPAESAETTMDTFTHFQSTVIPVSYTVLPSSSLEPHVHWYHCVEVQRVLSCGLWHGLLFISFLDFVQRTRSSCSNPEFPVCQQPLGKRSSFFVMTCHRIPSQVPTFSIQEIMYFLPCQHWRFCSEVYICVVIFHGLDLYMVEQFWHRDVGFWSSFSLEREWNPQWCHQPLDSIRMTRNHGLAGIWSCFLKVTPLGDLNGGPLPLMRLPAMNNSAKDSIYAKIQIAL